MSYLALVENVFLLHYYFKCLSGSLGHATQKFNRPFSSVHMQLKLEDNRETNYGKTIACGSQKS
jgi:hypothetical protein